MNYNISMDTEIKAFLNCMKCVSLLQGSVFGTAGFPVWTVLWSWLWPYVTSWLLAEDQERWGRRSRQPGRKGDRLQMTLALCGS